MEWAAAIFVMLLELGGLAALIWWDRHGDDWDFGPVARGDRWRSRW